MNRRESNEKTWAYIQGCAGVRWGTTSGIPNISMHLQRQWSQGFSSDKCQSLYYLQGCLASLTSCLYFFFFYVQTKTSFKHNEHFWNIHTCMRTDARTRTRTHDHSKSGLHRRFSECSCVKKEAARQQCWQRCWRHGVQLVHGQYNPRALREETKIRNGRQMRWPVAHGGNKPRALYEAGR